MIATRAREDLESLIMTATRDNGFGVGPESTVSGWASGDFRVLPSSFCSAPPPVFSAGYVCSELNCSTPAPTAEPGMMVGSKPQGMASFGSIISNLPMRSRRVTMSPKINGPRYPNLVYRAPPTGGPIRSLREAIARIDFPVENWRAYPRDNPDIAIPSCPKVILE